MEQIPREIIYMLGEYLAQQDIKNLALTCKHNYSCIQERIWEQVRIVKRIRKGDINILTSHPIKKMYLTLGDGKVTIQTIKSIKSLKEVNLDVKKCEDIDCITDFKNCNFVLHITTEKLPRDIDMLNFIQIIKSFKNVELTLCGDNILIGLDELRDMIGIRIRHLNTSAIRFYGYCSNPTKEFVEIVNHLKPYSISIATLTEEYLNDGLLCFDQLDLACMASWTIKTFHTKFLGYSHGLRLPYLLMEKLIRITSINHIFFQHNCREEIKDLCKSKGIYITFDKYS